MDVLNSRGAIRSLPDSCIGIEYLMNNGLDRWKGEGIDGRRFWVDKGEWATGALTCWTKFYSGIYYFTVVFFESVVFIVPVEPAYLRAAATN
ncbi:hypothetical protein EVAR_76019_1 [Eumeta japonica]|uniref:Uncharacterized protein n=1 Tax=Eumeta variegata TaxID=151549 RepID=A0A4C1UA66_EUMVA|nr:hypothetical protein EVAR_76019_1 [Eumeta japonica]